MGHACDVARTKTLCTQLHEILNFQCLLQRFGCSCFYVDFDFDFVFPNTLHLSYLATICGSQVWLHKHFEKPYEIRLMSHISIALSAPGL